jgi:hypothetical protein
MNFKNCTPLMAQEMKNHPDPNLAPTWQKLKFIPTPIHA